MGIVGSMPRMFNKFRKGTENWRMRKLWDQLRPVITVAQDGSGDFQKVEDALRVAEDLGGAYIIVKEGTYTVPAESADVGKTFPSNTLITGDGLNTLIIISTPSGSAKPTISFISKSKIILKNFKLQCDSGAGNPVTVIDLTGSSDITFDHLYVDQTSANFHTCLIGTPTGTITRMELIYTKFVDAAAIDYVLGNSMTLIDCVLNYCDLGTAMFVSEYAVALTRLRLTNCYSGYFEITGGIDCLIKGNKVAGTSGIVLNTSTRTRVIGNTLNGGGGTKIRLNVGSNYNNVIGNIMDDAVVDSGTGNTVANNTIY